MSSSVCATLDQFTLDHPSGEGLLRISVAAPAGPLPEGPVAVLYVVDADILFGLAAEIARVLAAVEGGPPLYVVGLGYDAGYADFLKLRTADLTTPISAAAAEAMGPIGLAIGGERNGGADTFLGFLVERLRPEIAARHPRTENGASVLFGHSLGGLFAAHALVTRPDAFAAFVISSPALWWDDFSLLRKVPALAERLATLPKPPHVFVDVGGKEQDLPASVPEGSGVTLRQAQEHIRAARMVDAARDLAEALAAAGIENLRHIAFAEEDHVSVCPPAMLHGMRFVLRHGG